jgi:ubiquitin C-terminal hydrolase
MYNVQTLPDVPPRDVLYHLQGVVWHRGTATSGHYLTEVFDPTKDRWYHCNDETITKENEKESLSHTNDNYLLFYVHHNCWPPAS